MTSLGGPPPLYHLTSSHSTFVADHVGGLLMPRACRSLVDDHDVHLYVKIVPQDMRLNMSHFPSMARARSYIRRGMKVSAPA